MRKVIVSLFLFASLVSPAYAQPPLSALTPEAKATLIAHIKTQIAELMNQLISLFLAQLSQSQQANQQLQQLVTLAGQQNHNLIQIASTTAQQNQQLAQIVQNTIPVPTQTNPIPKSIPTPISTPITLKVNVSSYQYYTIGQTTTFTFTGQGFTPSTTLTGQGLATSFTPDNVSSDGTQITFTMNGNFLSAPIYIFKLSDPVAGESGGHVMRIAQDLFAQVTGQNTKTISINITNISNVGHYISGDPNIAVVTDPVVASSTFSSKEGWVESGDIIGVNGAYSIHQDALARSFTYTASQPVKIIKINYGTSASNPTGDNITPYTDPL